MSTQLIMTIGTNALPIWVAWHHLKDLLGESVELRFIHTDQTEPEKDLLEQKISSECPGITILDAISVKPGEPNAIRGVINQNVIAVRPQECSHFHIHYTGGTKSMGVETVSIIEKELATAVDTTMNASYLNPRGSKGPEIVSRTALHVTDTRKGININLESIAELNGVKFEKSLTIPTSDQVRRGKGWLNAGWPFPPAYRETGENTGFVLEYGTYAAFKAALKNRNRRHWQLYRGIEGTRIAPDADPNRFELDVVAVLGYQVVVVSCVISYDPSKIKLKAMEAARRAKQLGGEEAHSITVCNATHDSCENKIQAGLEDEIGDDNPHLRVWGRSARGSLRNFQSLTSMFSNYLQDLSW